MRIDETVRGTRIIGPDEAEVFRSVIERLADEAEDHGFREVILPAIELASLYEGKIGDNRPMTFTDAGGRECILRPEGTATLQRLAQTTWKRRKDIWVYYIARCFRHDRPQRGRWREFTQFGVEWLNPSDPDGARESCAALADNMLNAVDIDAQATSVPREASYYSGEGIEARVGDLQVMGGGPYPEGYGFAFGVDRIVMLLRERAATPTPAPTTAG